MLLMKNHHNSRWINHLLWQVPHQHSKCLDQDIRLCVQKIKYWFEFRSDSLPLDQKIFCNLMNCWCVIEVKCHKWYTLSSWLSDLSFLQLSCIDIECNYIANYAKGHGDDFTDWANVNLHGYLKLPTVQVLGGAHVEDALKACLGNYYIKKLIVDWLLQWIAKPKLTTF